jgi:rhamnopyranosyl-N-acetylglucosaminyl-diphospho-decaprenol beta-1,3/1,4-galactofuranosyltransferase
MVDGVDFAGRCSSIAAVIVSRDRFDDLEKTVLAVLSQRNGTAVSIFIVDSSVAGDTVQSRFSAYPNIRVVRASVNLGGAGGFAFGILNALASGAEWIWLMDDDGCPYQSDTLERLLSEATRRGLDAVSPVVLDANDVTRFAFPYPIDHQYVFNRDQLPDGAFIPSVAHLFNGLLISAKAVFAIGLPDLRLFIRGDEIDFLLRMRRAKLRFGTVTSAQVTHPSSNNELHPVFRGRLHVVYPEPLWKRRIQYRNRAYNHLRSGMFLIIAIDLIRYPYFFLVKRRLDFAGLADWFHCTWAGLMGRVEAASIVTDKPQQTIFGPDSAATMKELVP